MSKDPAPSLPRHALTSAGLLGAALPTATAHGAIVPRPDLATTLEATVNPNDPFAFGTDSIVVDLVPDDLGSSDPVIGISITGDLLGTNSLSTSLISVSVVFQSIPVFGFTLLMEPPGTVLDLTVPNPSNDFANRATAAFDLVPGAGQPAAPPGQLTYVPFSFQSVNPVTLNTDLLYGFFGFTFERVEEANGDVTAKLHLSDFAYDDDPTITSLTLGTASVPTLIGDYNGNGQVEQGDLDLVLLNWGDDTDLTVVPAGWVNDLPTGLIDQAELDGVLLNWGNLAESNSPLPEPAGLGALAAGLMAAGGRRRR